MSLITSQQRQYVASVLEILKKVAFHELYMEKIRQELAKAQHYDPLTAFKAIDSFKSGEIIGFELRSYLQNYGISATDRQCDTVLHSLNKGLIRFTDEDFQELTLPKDSRLRNQSLARYKQMEVEVGVLSLVYEIKSTSAKKIASFFEKEIDFQRKLSLQKLDFCRKYGGDLYTFSQVYLQAKSKHISYDRFYEVSRKYDYFFNTEEFQAIYARSKSQPQHFGCRQTHKIQPALSTQMLSHLLQTNQLDYKRHLQNQAKQPPNEQFVQQPSYKQNVFERENRQKIKKQYQGDMRAAQNYKHDNNNLKHGFRYHYSRPQFHFYPKDSHQYFVNQQRDWMDEVGRMDEIELNVRYRMIGNRSIMRK